MITMMWPEANYYLSYSCGLLVEAIYVPSQHWLKLMPCLGLCDASLTNCHLFHFCENLARVTVHPTSTWCLFWVYGPLRGFRKVCSLNGGSVILWKSCCKQLWKLGWMEGSQKNVQSILFSLPKSLSKINTLGFLKPNSIAIRSFLSLVTSLRFYIPCLVLASSFVPAA